MSSGYCEAFIDAHQRNDAKAALEAAAADIRVTMPPASLCFDGSRSAHHVAGARPGAGPRGGLAPGAYRGQPNACRGQLPTPSRGV